MITAAMGRGKMTKYIEKESAVNYPVMPKEYRKYPTMNLDDAYEQGWFDLEDLLEKLPAADVAPRWIPVTERLPEEDYETGNGVQFSADVLATIVNHANDGELYVWLLKTVDGKWYDYTPNEYGTHKIPYWCEVIAWMPLPTPYKGGEEE